MDTKILIELRLDKSVVEGFKPIGSVRNTISKFAPADIEAFAESYKRFIIDHLIQFVEQPQEVVR